MRRGCVVRLWISRDSTIPVRDQLAAQLRFGILTGRLVPAERLPSVRDLAQRLKIHPNTVSAAFQDLAAGRMGLSEEPARASSFSDIKRGATQKTELKAFVANLIEEAV